MAWRCCGRSCCWSGSAGCNISHAQTVKCCLFTLTSGMAVWTAGRRRYRWSSWGSCSCLNPYFFLYHVFHLCAQARLVGCGLQQLSLEQLGRLQTSSVSKA